MKNKGFTLIEIIITIVILGIIGVFSFSFFGHLIGTYTTMGAKTKAHMEAAYALERITRELRDAKKVKLINMGNDNYIIEFEKANPKDSPTDSYGQDNNRQDNNRYVKFYKNKSGTDLYRDSARNANFTEYVTSNLIAKNVKTFEVTVPDGTPLPDLPLNTKITIKIEITSGDESQTYKVDVCPKNYAENGSCNFTGRSFGGCYEEKIY